MIRNIAIIPARSGSKGVKDKNIRELLGKPLLAYSIEAAEKSGCFDNIFVSTDDERYALIAEKYGADASFLRSEETSSDTADSWSVVREVIDRLKIQGKRYDEYTAAGLWDCRLSDVYLPADDELFRIQSGCYQFSGVRSDKEDTAL